MCNKLLLILKKKEMLTNASAWVNLKQNKTKPHILSNSTNLKAPE